MNFADAAFDACAAKAKELGRRLNGAEWKQTVQSVYDQFQAEAAAATELLGHLLGLFLIDLALDFLDQRQHVAHAEDARGDTVRVERFERVGLDRKSTRLNSQSH